MEVENLSKRINHEAGGTTLIIPVYNSANTLHKLHSRIINVLSENDIKYEIIFINDGSTDNSWGILCELNNHNKKIKTINLSKNYGQHNALLCGIREARYNTIVTLDDDLQNPPEEIPKLLKKLNEGFDVVYGYPKRERQSFLRNISSKLTKLALKTAMGIENAEHVSSFRAFKSQIRQAFDQYKGSFVSIDVLLSWGTNSFSSIPVDFDERTNGKSNYSFNKLIQHALNMITGFSIIPLQIASITGLFLAFFGVGVLIFVLARFFLQGSPVPGFPFLASIISIFSGAQLLAIGIIGEYLSRIHFRSMEKPQYHVSRIDE